MTRGGEITSIESSEALENIDIRTAKVLGMLTIDNKIQANIPSKDRSQFSQEKYKFMLDAPFEVSNQCCNAMKKKPLAKYKKETGRIPITAQMASESRLRTQQWLKAGCNAFDNNKPIANPMSFWTEQDVLLYIKLNNIEICSVYGEVITDNAKMGEIDNQINFEDLGLFDKGTATYKTSKLQRTGCMFCGYGCHLEKSPNRFEQMKETHPKQYDYIMRPKEQGGLDYKNVIEWINENGNMDIKY